MGFFDKLKKGLGVGDLGPSGLSGILESIHSELESSKAAVGSVSTRPIQQFLQEIGKVSNPDEFSESEALHPLRRGKRVFFYHASPSPIAPHLMVHPEIEKAIDFLSKEGIIKPAELEAAKNPETLLNIITERVTNQFSGESPVRRGTERVRKFLSGEFQQDAASVFHAGTLSSARDRMGPDAKSGSNVFLHAYEVDTSAVETAIHDDIMLGATGPPSADLVETYDRAVARSVMAEDINLNPTGRDAQLRGTIATGKKVSLSGQVHPYRNAIEDVGNVSVSIPRTAVGSSVRYAGAVDMTPVMNPTIFDEFVRQPIVAARRALGTLGAKVSSAADDIAESAGPVKRVSRRLGVMSRGTLAKVIEAGETAARVMR